VRHQVSYPPTTGKIIVLYLLIIGVLDWMREDKRLPIVVTVLSVDEHLKNQS
jgi:hypothetical protein